MNKIFTVAEMLFKRRFFSFAYYWMLLAPLAMLFLIFGLNQYNNNQIKDNKAQIAVVGNSNIRSLLIQNKSSTYTVRKINPKAIKTSLKSNIIDGALYVNKDMSKISYKYNSSSNATNPVKELYKNISIINSQKYAAKLGLNINQWKRITSNNVKIKDVPLNREKDRVKNSTFANYFSEMIVFITFLFLNSYVSIMCAEVGKEKGNHLIDEIIAAIPAKDHLKGKLLGISWLMISQVIIYIIIGFIAFVFLKMNNITNPFGIDSYLKGISIEYIVIVSILAILAILLFILLSVIIASFTSKIEDVSQAATITSTFVIIPYLLSFLTQSNPNSLISKALSYIPFTNHTIMTVRLAYGVVTFNNSFIAIFLSLLLALILYKVALKTYSSHIFYYSNESILNSLLNLVYPNNGK
ncbi:ABC transporter permease [Nicoliella spurrieriana]|uniref:ABC transporter permease n=1 Tax=Nicoliella spurrieriana TaxID=2925830 RepID=A0A976RT41_9LACO|nr:ABC transporter permease [Nicoliella spurrieriana]UQS87308.1 ABC transporter permease [Nicoliella spurrieriana]